MKTFICILFLFPVIVFAVTTLRLIGDVNLPTSTKFQETELGGLSGITYDSRSGKLIAVSDDRGWRGDGVLFAPRFYTFGIFVKSDSVEIVPEVVTIFDTGDGNYFPPMFLDVEGVALTGNGQMIISSEGYTPFISPKIMEFDINGKFLKLFKVPEKFIPLTTGSQQQQGVFRNAAFESLTISHDKSLFFTATELGLKQDGAKFSRILSYSRKGETYLPSKEYIYILGSGVGMAELLYLETNQFIALERGWDEVLGQNRIYLQHVSLEGATDVSSMFKIDDFSKITTVKKDLILNLDDVVPLFSEGYRLLDNIEGMTFGPKLANGNKTLILVSDNNFKKSQRTLFLVFEMIGE